MILPLLGEVSGSTEMKTNNKTWQQQVACLQDQAYDNRAKNKHGVGRYDTGLCAKHPQMKHNKHEYAKITCAKCRDRKIGWFAVSTSLRCFFCRCDE